MAYKFSGKKNNHTYIHTYIHTYKTVFFNNDTFYPYILGLIKLWLPYLSLETSVTIISRHNPKVQTKHDGQEFKL